MLKIPKVLCHKVQDSQKEIFVALSGLGTSGLERSESTAVVAMGVG